jgi:hypothetical protein
MVVKGDGDPFLGPSFSRLHSLWEFVNNIFYRERLQNVNKLHDRIFRAAEYVTNEMLSCTCVQKLNIILTLVVPLRVPILTPTEHIRNVVTSMIKKICRLLKYTGCVTKPDGFHFILKTFRYFWRTLYFIVEVYNVLFCPFSILLRTLSITMCNELRGPIGRGLAAVRRCYAEGGITAKQRGTAASPRTFQTALVVAAALKKGSFKTTVTQILTTVRGMKNTPLLHYPHHYVLA